MTIQVTIGGGSAQTQTSTLTNAPPDVGGDLTVRIYAVNVGGPTGDGWVADTPYINPEAEAAVHPDTLSIDLSGVTAPAPEKVYRSERYAPSGSDAVTLAFRIEQARHLVRVHLAENWSGAMAVGGRVHTVELGVADDNTGVVWTAVDVFALAGAGNKAHILEAVVTTPASASDLTVRVGRSSGNHPRVQGVEVFSDVALGTDPGPGPDPDPDPGVSDPSPPTAWGSFPTHLNAGWSTWHLNEVNWSHPTAPAYVLPPPMPARPTVPAGAVAVTPSTIVTEVNNRSAGTTFVLAAGQYNLTVPVKAGNRYFGDRNNPTAVVIHGQDTRHIAFGQNVSGVEIYYITWQFHLGDGNRQGTGAVNPLAANWKVVGCVGRWNKHSGIRLTGSNGQLSHYQGYENGQYAISGPASGWVIDCAEIYRNGSAGLPAGVTRFAGSDRGATKMGQNYALSSDGVNLSNGGRITVRRFHSYGHDTHGLWFDIRISDIRVEYSWFENNARIHINYEAGAPNGYPIITRFNRCIDGTNASISGDWWRNWYVAVPMGIRFSVCRNGEVYGNVVNGVRGGIGGYNFKHPQLDGSTSTPGSDGRNACSVADWFVHHNYMRAHGGGAPDCSWPSSVNPSSMVAGITQLGTWGSVVRNAYLSAENNRWRNNVYSGTHKMQWGTVGGGSSGCITPAQWAGFGHT